MSTFLDTRMKALKVTSAIDVLRKSAQIIAENYGIEVQFVGNKCQTNGKIIMVPSLPENAANDLINAIIGHIDHEVGHVRHTDFAVQNSHQKEFKADKRLFSLSNAIEDVRQEHLMSAEYRGIGLNLKTSAEWLLKRVEPKFPMLKGFDRFSYLLTLRAYGFGGHDVSMTFYNKHAGEMARVVEVFDDRIRAFITLPDTAAAIQEAKDILKEFDDLKDKCNADKKEERNEQDQSDEGDDGGDDDRFGEGEGDEGDDGGDGGDGEGDEGDDGGDGEGDDDSEPSKKNKGDDDQGDASGDDAGQGSGDDDKDDDGEDSKGKGKDDDDGDTSGTGDDDGGSYTSEDDHGEDGEDDGGKLQSVKSGEVGDDKDKGELGKPELDEMSVVLDDIGLPSGDHENGPLHTDMLIEISGAAEALPSKEYRSYTQTFDRDVTPEGGSTEAYNKAHEKVKPFIHVIEGVLRRVLLAQKRDGKVYGQNSGRLNMRALATIKAGNTRVFKRRNKGVSLNTYVEVIIDHSGSMASIKIDMAEASCIALAEALDKIGVPFGISGFSTSLNEVGLTRSKVREQEAMRNDFEYNWMNDEWGGWHRIWPILEFVYKRPDDTMNKARPRMSRISYMCRNYGGSNCDGASLMRIAKRVAKRREDRKLLIVLSDGQPITEGSRDMAYATEPKYLKSVVKMIEGTPDMDIFGLGICDKSVKHYYKKHVTINKLDELPVVIMNHVKSALLKK